ncbi:sensor histidine kinase [Aquirufa beregesia]
MKFSHTNQIFIAVGVVFFTSILCFFSTQYMGYRAIALVLLMVTSLIAMFFDVVPVLVTATLSALIWNFWFIPPRFTFHITYSEDLLLFLMYFFIALVNGLLTVKIRQAEAKARDKEEKELTIGLYNTLLNSLSHELRTPIATILGTVETLKDEDETLSREQKSELFQGVETASLRLNQQVENLLNMSRLESGNLKLSLDWVDMTEWGHQVLAKFSSDANQRSISLEVGNNLPLYLLDVGIMDQMVGNLLRNSLHYTANSVPIFLRIVFDKEQLEIKVSDEGPGFPEELIPFVFDKFYRLPNTIPGGTGLGLSIVKGYVEACGGTITLRNLDFGCEFIIRIPATTSYVNYLKNE